MATQVASWAAPATPGAQRFAPPVRGAPRPRRDIAIIATAGTCVAILGDANGLELNAVSALTSENKWLA
ncbi:hypothetical protein GCM10023222_30700 [Saccharopolyspora cebuensis]